MKYNDLCMLLYNCASLLDGYKSRDVMTVSNLVTRDAHLKLPRVSFSNNTSESASWAS